MLNLGMMKLAQLTILALATVLSLLHAKESRTLSGGLFVTIAVEQNTQEHALVNNCQQMCAKDCPPIPLANQT